MLWTMGHSRISELLQAVDRGEFAFDIEGKENQITCPTLALAGEAEGEELLRQTHQFYENISTPDREIKIFTLEEDASDDHCQLDNRTRANQIVFDWLDDVFRLSSKSDYILKKS
jgi:hypothetical protein